MRRQAKLFKALSVNTRLRIIELLKAQPLSVNSLAVALHISPSAVSQHLSILKSLGLVEHRRLGYWTHYSLNEGQLECCRQELSRLCTCRCLERGSIDVRKLEEYQKELEKELRRVRGLIRRVKER